MKKMLILVLALSLLFSMVLVGCNAKEDDAMKEETKTEKKETKEETKTEETTGVEFNEPGMFPIVKEAGSVTLEIMVAPEPWLGQFGEDNWMTGYYEEKTGIKVEWLQIAREEKDTRINLMLSGGGDLPDIFMLSIGKDLLTSYGAEGIFIPLNDYIDELGMGIRLMEEADPLLLGQITAPDGNIYSLVERNECYHCDISQRFWINQTWLTNLGLAAPTTTEAFKSVLIDFKNQDANGNGDTNDEIPLITTTDFWNGKLFGFLNNPFVFTPSANGEKEIYVEDGVVKSSVNQEGWKESIKYLAGMYAEGLIYEEAFTVTTDLTRQLSGATEGNRIGSFPGGYQGGVCDLNPDAKAKEDFVALLPLEGPTGLQQAPLGYTSVNTCFAITSGSENPEAAFRWGDSLQIINSSDAEFQGGGPEDVVWRRGIAGEVGLDGRTNFEDLRKPLTTYGEPHNWHWGQPKPVMATNEQRFSSVSPQGTWDLETELYIARTAYTPLASQDLVLPLYMKTPEEAATISEYATLNETINNWYALFVTGEKDVDEEWDDYLAAISAEGLDEVIAVEQGAYDRFVANMG